MVRLTFYYLAEHRIMADAVGVPKRNIQLYGVCTSSLDFNNIGAAERVVKRIAKNFINTYAPGMPNKPFMVRSYSLQFSGYGCASVGPVNMVITAITDAIENN